MKGIRCWTLYYLHTSIVNGSLKVSTSFFDDARLWHMRLGHVSDKGMTILSRRDLFGNQGIGELDFCEHCVFEKIKESEFFSSYKSYTCNS